MKEHEESLEEIYEHFGEDNQNLKLKEEVKELFHELTFMIDDESVIDEEADVLIVLYQKYLNNAKLRAYNELVEVNAGISFSPVA